MPTENLSIPESVREGVLQSLPIIKEIQDAKLRRQVIEAWSMTLFQNNFERLEDVDALPGLGHHCPQPKHITAVAKMALALADLFDEALDEPLGLDRDLLLACAVCHDLGNPYEYNREKRKGWEQDPKREGFPCLRHTFYGVHVALSAGLPESVAHACACHSQEGGFVKRSLATELIYHVDHMFWQVIKSAHGLL